MKVLREYSNWQLYGVIALVVGVTLFILGCGADPTATPTRAPAATIDISGITSDVKTAIQEEIGKIQPPLSEDEIRDLIERAVSTSVPESVSAQEIQSMVDSAVAAAAAAGVTQADVTAAIGEAVAAAAAAAPEPLSAMDIERIVKGFHTDACTCGYGYGYAQAYAGGYTRPPTGGLQNCGCHASHGHSGHAAPEGGLRGRYPHTPCL